MSYRESLEKLFLKPLKTYNMNMVLKVTIIGFGLMGSGIAQVFAMNNYEVLIYDISMDAIKKGLNNIKWSLEKLQEKGRLKEDPETIMKRLKVIDNLANACKEADLIVEAIFEDPKVKVETFREVEKYVRKDTIITSNTSGISITYLQQALTIKDRFAGFHWFNPPVLMRLIEIIKGKYTSDQTLSTLVELARKLSKEPIIVKRDVRSFVANRVYRTLRYHACILYMRKIYDYKAIDSALIYKLGLPMGVFELMDFTGGAQIEYTESRMYEEVKKSVPEWEPHVGYEKAYKEFLKLAKQLVEENRIGVKSGKGFYEYPEPGKWTKPSIPKELGENVSLEDLLAPVINQAVYMVRTGITSSDDIDKALKLGFNWPKGIFEIYKEKFSKEKIIETLNNLKSKIPDLAEFYEPDKGLLGE